MVWLFNPQRKAAVVAMMMRPVINNGLGCVSEANTESIIAGETANMCKWLLEGGFHPAGITAETFELLVWKEIFILCGEEPFPWDKEFERSRKDYPTFVNWASEYDGYYFGMMSYIIKGRREKADSLRGKTFSTLNGGQRVEVPVHHTNGLPAAPSREIQKEAEAASMVRKFAGPNGESMAPSATVSSRSSTKRQYEEQESEKIAKKLRTGA